VKRRDPWHRANALRKAAAVPGLNGADAETSYRRVCSWFASRWRNHQSKRAEKPHSIIQRRKPLDGPATRPQTPLAVENSAPMPLWKLLLPLLFKPMLRLPRLPKPALRLM
jgi:hypothetical protein